MSLMHGRIEDANVKLELRRPFDAAGAPILLETNSQDVVDSFSQEFPPTAHTPEFTFRIEVHKHPRDIEFGTPRFFGMDQYAGALFGDQDFMSFDLHKGFGLGYFSFVAASDRALWRRVILPTSIGLVGPQLGTVPIHCAALEFQGAGVLISGLSGSGKSTLTAALVEAGLQYVADDWSFVSDRDGLRAYGTAAPIKLMPDTNRFFPALRFHAARKTLNGEIAYEIESEEFGGTPVRSCRPKILFLLERGEGRCSFQRVGTDEAIAQLYSSLEPISATLRSAKRHRDRVVASVARLNCWKFVCGGSPRQAAQELISMLRMEVGR
jgi:hypothetical protein